MQSKTHPVVIPTDVAVVGSKTFQDIVVRKLCFVLVCCGDTSCTHVNVIVASSWLSILFIFHYIFLRLSKQSQFIPLQNVVFFITLPFLIRKIFIFYLNDVLLFKCRIPGPKG